MSATKKHVARNVFAEIWKDKYYGIQVTSNTTDGNSIAASTDRLAVCWETGSGGTVAVFNNDQLNEKKPSLIFFRGHTGAVQDIQFCPFYNTIFATASEDTTVKLWDCAASLDLQETRQDAVATLKGHSKRVCFTAFNEIAEWVIASGSTDGTVRVWDLEVQKDVRCHAMDTHPVSLRWNSSASLIALTNKNRELMILDPRQDAVVGGPTPCHEGAKPSRLDWCANSRSVSDQYLVTAGFSKSAERQIRLWDTRRLNEPVVHLDLDRSSAILQPYVDVGTGMLLLYGKGNRSIYFFGIEPTEFVKFGEFEQLEPWKDVAIAPKRAVDVQKCEVLRCYGSCASSNVIQPITVGVHRRNMGAFHEDLFPDCPVGEATMNAEEWFDGRNASPKLGSMAPGATPIIEKRPINSGSLEFNRDLAAVRDTSSVLKKRLSTTTQNSQGLLRRMEELETELEQSRNLIREQARELDSLRLNHSAAKNSSCSSPAVSSNVASSSLVNPSLDAVDRKLAELALRTCLTEKNVAELRELITHAARLDRKPINAESPLDIIQVLLERIAHLQRVHDRVVKRNETLESVYTSLRKF